ncbi:hypothetical protein [Rhodothermus profundi]|uniref:CRISPR-associated protein, Cmr3 family n=1 Tax=Rhodothermus profundi TaxID=633813 RepID=A0A1M6UF92_9BACT|nr:hypothetical protein [Rhodothermus profundi]SHK67884.1 hypothetical protein SAMN04488087_1681 [Rhodothermus profundi]
MSWTLYRWVWQLHSPLYIGHTPAGALNRTRLYIPARNMWAALTAEVARQRASSSFPNYEDIGRKLQEHARFTYLFPAEQVNGHWYAWLPRYEEDKGLLWHREDGKNEPDRRFRRRFLHTRPSTAIAPGSGAAEEGTLREVECIATHWKPAQGQAHDQPSPVAFVGYVFLNDTLPQHLQSALKDVREVFIGGETRYGFGHLVLLPFSKRKPWEEAEKCFGDEVELNGDTPVVKQPSYLVAHGVFPSAKGDREALVQWDWQTPRPICQLYWQPGTQILEPKEEELEFVFFIERDGFWTGRRKRKT